MIADFCVADDSPRAAVRGNTVLVRGLERAATDVRAGELPTNAYRLPAQAAFGKLVAVSRIGVVVVIEYI